MNVVLYGAGGKRWAMTERGRGALARDARALRIGPSAMRWDGTALTVEVEEWTFPLPSRLRGVVRLTPLAPPSPRGFVLDAAGRHRWRPIAPVSRVEVAFDNPALRWSGPAYLDTNAGEAPLEEDFREWDWCRGPMPDGGGAILYNAVRRQGGAQSLALRIGPDGTVREVEPPPPAELPPGLWGVRRPTRADAGAAPRLLMRMEDAPFYTRSAVATRLFGAETAAVHESLSLDRFANPVVQAMLAFRIPRRG
jgi:carotenoid 1,2-hydratase